MSHLRNRYLETILRKTLSFSSIVGIIGHRQVGKTTLLEEVCASYETLDSKITRQEVEKDPEKFLAKKTRRAPLGIDECQIEPEIFPALKEHVRKNKKPGQFLLSGSIRFTSRKAIQESLTGRIISFELLPFTVSELESKPLPQWGPKALKYGDLSHLYNDLKGSLSLHSAHLTRYSKLIDTYFVQGGLPGICFIRDRKLRDLKIDAQLETLLDRDLRFLQKTSLSYTTIRSLCSVLAKRQGQPLDYTFLQGQTGISTPTIKKLLYALEGIFLIRLIPIEGGRKGHSVFFEDQAEAHRLGGDSHSERDRVTHFLFQQFRAQFEYQLGGRSEAFQYRTRGGAIVPVCFRNSDGVLGIIPLESPDETARSLASANSFLKSYDRSKILMLYRGHYGKEAHISQPRILIAPIAAVI
jgi:predicted AAA+ superfamily ATPase